jgi:hypothetical protein
MFCDLEAERSIYGDFLEKLAHCVNNLESDGLEKRDGWYERRQPHVGKG